MLSILLFSLSIFLFIILAVFFLIRSRKRKSIERYESISEASKGSRINIKALMIIGPSGVGKDSFMEILIGKYPTIFAKCISYTTRSPRVNEKEGINYYYISKEKFNELDKKGDIIGKFEKYNNLYGTSKQIISQILGNDKIVYFDYNIETAIKTFEEGKLEFNYIAILPPSIEELRKRLRKRGTEDENAIQKRIDFAKKEVELINNCKFLNYVVINDKLDRSAIEFELKLKELYPLFFQ